MNDETFNLSIRKFLKTVGVSSQREIEQVGAKLRARMPFLEPSVAPTSDPVPVS